MGRMHANTHEHVYITHPFASQHKSTRSSLCTSTCTCVLRSPSPPPPAIRYRNTHRTAVHIPPPAIPPPGYIPPGYTYSTEVLAGLLYPGTHLVAVIAAFTEHACLEYSTLRPTRLYCLEVRTARSRHPSCVGLNYKQPLHVESMHKHTVTHTLDTRPTYTHTAHTHTHTHVRRLK